MQPTIDLDTAGYGLPASRRFHSSFDYNAVFRARNLLRGHGVQLRWVVNQLGYSRLGAIIPKRVGNAVRRNSIKRQLREFFRTQIKPDVGYDFVFSFHPTKNFSGSALREALYALMAELQEGSGGSLLRA